MPKYELIRDNQIYNIPEDNIEVCDTREEIIKFGTKQIINNILELQEYDYRDLDLYVDIFELLYYLAELSFIDSEQIEDYLEEKLEKEGGYSKYLRKG